MALPRISLQIALEGTTRRRASPWHDSSSTELLINVGLTWGFCTCAEMAPTLQMASPMALHFQSTSGLSLFSRAKRLRPPWRISTKMVRRLVAYACK